MHAPVLEKFWRTGRFGHMNEFYADAREGKLPAYAFIEQPLGGWLIILGCLGEW